MHPNANKVLFRYLVTLFVSFINIGAVFSYNSLPSTSVENTDALLVPAAMREFKFENISTEQGLSQVSVNAITQDSKGYMWFGTQNGLNRYDGYKITKHNNEKRAYPYYGKSKRDYVLPRTHTREDHLVVLSPVLFCNCVVRVGRERVKVQKHSV